MIELPLQALLSISPLEFPPLPLAFCSNPQCSDGHRTWEQRSGSSRLALGLEGIQTPRYSDRLGTITGEINQRCPSFFVYSAPNTEPGAQLALHKYLMH